MYQCVNDRFIMQILQTVALAFSPTMATERNYILSTSRSLPGIRLTCNLMMHRVLPPSGALHLLLNVTKQLYKYC